METGTKDRSKTWFWCFWMAVIIIFVVFILPIETHTIGSGDSSVTFSYTIWDKITGTGPKNAEFRLPR